VTLSFETQRSSDQNIAKILYSLNSNLHFKVTSYSFDF